MFNSKENGFSLIELIVVLIITAILAQLGFTAFDRYARRTRAFAAKTALKNIQRECESNRDLEAPETFTLLPIKGYSIATRDTDSCLGQSSDGKVAAIADNQEEIPSYFYDFLTGVISCSFSNSSSGMFKSCTNGNGNGNGSISEALANYCNNDPKPTSCQTTGLGGYAVVQEDGTVSGVIVSTSNDPWGTGNPGVMPMEYMGCPAGCRLIRQTNPSNDGNVFGYHGPNIKYSDGVFTLEDGTKIKDGVGIRPNGEIYNTGNGEVLN